jgi:NADP-dependent alcohol dehydrogenase
MWCATQALNGLIGCGVPQDWATHMIGHELTALYGIDHAQSLAVVLPGLLQQQKQRKKAKLLQYGERIWGITTGTDDDRAEQAIRKTEEFFRSVGIGTTLKDYGIPVNGIEQVGQRIQARGTMLGEYADLGQKEIDAILAQRIS